MPGPTTRLTRRDTAVPVYTLRSEPGAPAMGVMRIDEEALAWVGGQSHVHDFPGIIYFEGSGGGLRSHDRPWGIEAGDAFLVRPGELVDIDDAEELVAARGRGLFFTPEALAGTAEGGPDPSERLSWRVHPLLWPFASSVDEPVRFRVPAEQRPMWTSTVSAIERELHDRRDGYRQAAIAHLVVLLVATARLVERPTVSAPASGDLVDRVFAVIESGFRDRLSLTDVATTLHLSPGHLTTTIRELTGRTVQDWIAERRLTEARRLLLETELPIQEIGRRVGYPDPGYFARVFRQAHGVTPRAWRAGT